MIWVASGGLDSALEVDRTMLSYFPRAWKLLGYCGGYSLEAYAKCFIKRLMDAWNLLQKRLNLATLCFFFRKNDGWLVNGEPLVVICSVRFPRSRGTRYD